MATYVFFEGYGEWCIAELPLGECYDIHINRHQYGYFMLSLENEMLYKHLGILSLEGRFPLELLPCKEKINGCAFQKVIHDGWDTSKTSYTAEWLIESKKWASFYINYNNKDKKYSLVVVDLKDIQTVDQPPAQNSSQESEVSTMQALAIMAWMLSEKNSHYKIAGRPNAKNINDAIQPLVEEAFPKDPPKLKSFNKKISEALKLFNPE